MNASAYDALYDGRTIYGVLPSGFVRVTGRDRLPFLNGQLTADIRSLGPGASTLSCLLSNTGHMISMLTVFETDGAFVLQTPPGQSEPVIRTLGRFVVREKAFFEDVSCDYALLTMQGSAHRETLRMALPALDSSTVVGSFQRRRTPAPYGYDCVVSSSDVPALSHGVAQAEAVLFNPAEYDLLRIEAGISKWGSELTEALIPLEAGLDDAISTTKGCYMGQEVIARIISRGHTNRSIQA